MTNLNLHVLIGIATAAIFVSCTRVQHNCTNTLIAYDPGPGWSLVWADEFNGAELDTNNWNYQVEEAGRFNGEWQRYTDSTDNAYVEDGKLVIRAMHCEETHGMDHYTSARLNTANKQAWTHGKIVSRIKIPGGKGIWPAFWMLGANINENGGDTRWPLTGEIDIFELYGTRNPAVVEANIHYADEKDDHTSMGAVRYELDEGKFSDSFHVFSLEWDTEEIRWAVDGNEYAVISIKGPEFTEFHKDFFLLYNIAVGSPHAGFPDETTPFPQHMYIDWVRVYQRRLGTANQ